jgi:hypothetical protein
MKKTHIIVIDKAKNICLFPSEWWSEIDFKKMKVIKREATQGEIDKEVRKFLRGEYDESES